MADAGSDRAGWSEIVRARIGRPAGGGGVGARGVTDALLGLARAGARRGRRRARRGGRRAARAATRPPRGRLPGGEAALEPIRAETAALRSWLGAALGRGSARRSSIASRGAGELWSSPAHRGGDGGCRAAGRVGGHPARSWSPTIASAGPRRTCRRSYTRARECLRPLAEAGRMPGHPGLHRRHRRRDADHAGPRRLRLHRRAARAAVLDAERVEIWTDVNGLMTADPRIVPSRAHAPRRRATRRPRSWPPSAPRSSIRPPRCRWCARASRSWCSTRSRPEHPGHHHRAVGRARADGRFARSGRSPGSAASRW